MVGQQRKNDGADITTLDPLGTRTFKITEFLCQSQRVTASDDIVIRRCRSIEQAFVLPGKIVGGANQLLFRRIKQSTNEQSVLHHDSIPEKLTFTKIICAVVT